MTYFQNDIRIASEKFAMITSWNWDWFEVLRILVKKINELSEIISEYDESCEKRKHDSQLLLFYSIRC